MAKETFLYSPTTSHELPFSDLKEEEKKIAKTNATEFIQSEIDANNGKEFFQYFHRETFIEKHCVYDK